MFRTIGGDQIVGPFGKAAFHFGPPLGKEAGLHKQRPAPQCNFGHLSKSSRAAKIF